MSKIEEFFTPEKIAELEERVEHQKTQDSRWDCSSQARQHLEVYSKREALAELANMIDDIKQVESKIEAIQKFAKDNGLEDMVDFCCWSSPHYEIDSILQADVESDALAWAASNHNC